MASRTAYTTEKNWANNNPIAESDLDTYVTANMKHLRELLRSRCIVMDRKTPGTAGGGSTAGSWQTRDLNLKLGDTLSNYTLSSNQITLPGGKYLLKAWSTFADVDSVQIRLRDVTNSTTLGASAPAELGSATINGQIHVDGYVEVAAGATIAVELQYYCDTSTGSIGLGIAAGFSESQEYSSVEIIPLDWNVA